MEPSELYVSCVYRHARVCQQHSQFMPGCGRPQAVARTARAHRVSMKTSPATTNGEVVFSFASSDFRFSCIFSFCVHRSWRFFRIRVVGTCTPHTLSTCGNHQLPSPKKQNLPTGFSLAFAFAQATPHGDRHARAPTHHAHRAAPLCAIADHHQTLPTAIPLLLAQKHTNDPATGTQPSIRSLGPALAYDRSLFSLPREKPLRFVSLLQDCFPNEEETRTHIRHRHRRSATCECHVREPFSSRRKRGPPCKPFPPSSIALSPPLSRPPSSWSDPQPQSGTVTSTKNTSTRNALCDIRLGSSATGDGRKMVLSPTGGLWVFSRLRRLWDAGNTAHLEVCD